MTKSRFFLFASVGAALLAGAAPALAQEAPAEPAQKAHADEDVRTEVKVRGKAADTLERSTGSSTKVSEVELKRAQPQSTTEVFRRVPGMTVRSEDGMGLRLNLGVRGLSPTRGRLVLLQEDGVPVVVSPYGEPELYYSTPVERVQRLDVLKGPEVLLQGPQTVGGAVNIYAWAPPLRREWALEADYGQRGYGKILARYGNSTEDGDVRYVVQAFRKQGDGFRNMPFEATDVMGKLAFPTWKNGEATLKLVMYDELSNTTYTGLTQPLFRQNPRMDTVAPGDQTAIRRYEASIQHEQRLGDRTKLRTTLFAYAVNLKINLQDFDRGRLDGVSYDRVVGPDVIDGAALYFRNSRTLRDRDYTVAGVEPQLEHHFETGRISHKLQLGTRVMVDSARRKLSRANTPNGQTGELLSDDTTTIVGMAAYAQDRIAFRDSLLVTPTMRIEHADSFRSTRRVLEDGVSQALALSGHSSNTGFMPGLGFIWGKPVFNVFGGLHSGYSPPRVSQSITPTGKDANLDAERSMNYELGVRLRPSRFVRADVTTFMTNFDNQLISNNTLSGTSAEFKNGGSTRHVGGEVTALIKAGRMLKLPVDIDISGQYTHTRSTFVGGIYNGNFVPYAPQHTSTLTLDTEHKSGFGAQGSWSHVGKHYADEANSEEPDISGRAGAIPAYDVIDVGARYRHAPSGISIHLTVKNLTDNVYLSGRLPNGIFTAGYRQAFVGLKWTGP